MTKEPSQIPFQIQRTVFDLDVMDEKAQYQYPTKHYLRTIITGFKKVNYRKSIVKTIPILEWLSNYQWTKDFGSDLVCGFTVAVMHIPQGMSYALLAKLDPIIGIYMGFFPVFIYALFGTSRHVSIGTFAVLSIMCGVIVEKHASLDGNERPYSKLQVATALSANVALIQLAMYVFRLGVITTLLSDTVVNAFTCAASVHVLTSQLNDIFGLVLPKRGEFGRSILVFYDIGQAFSSTNWITFTLSTVFFAILVVYVEVLKPAVARRTSVPFPIELVCVVASTIISHNTQMATTHDVDVVGDVPTGLPHFKPPSLALMAFIAGDSVAVAIISYTITISMGLILAQKNGYEIQANQELLALGTSNIVGSFFSCMPVSASISRSVLQEGVGGKTQLASIICCAFLLNVVLYIGPLFKALPKCVLACITIVYLKSTLLQITNLKKYWFLNKWDFLVWILTFVTTVVVDVTLGLICGVCISLFSIFMRAQEPHTTILANVPGTELYCDVDCYKIIKETEGLKIFSYNGTISYLTKDIFKAALVTKVGLNPLYILEQRRRHPRLEQDSSGTMGIKCIVLSFSGIAYVDPSGVTTLIGIVDTFAQLDIVLFVAECPENVLEDIRKCEKYNNKVINFKMFPTVHDAVLFAEANVL